jgi:hypothetical protein
MQVAIAISCDFEQLFATVPNAPAKIKVYSY